MSKWYALEIFEITAQSKSVSFIPHPYYPAEICIPPVSKRHLVCHMTNMKEEHFLKKICSKHILYACNFKNMFYSKKK